MMMDEPEHSWGFKFSVVCAGGGNSSVVLFQWHWFKNKLSLSPPYPCECRKHLVSGFSFLPWNK